jgi:hypothetical protein
VLARRRHRLLAVGGHDCPQSQLSARTVRRVIARLEGEGHVVVHRGGGRAGSTNSYTVLTGTRSPGQSVAPDTPPGGDSCDRAPVTQPWHWDRGRSCVTRSTREPPANRPVGRAQRTGRRAVRPAGGRGGRGILRAARCREFAVVADGWAAVPPHPGRRRRAGRWLDARCPGCGRGGERCRDPQPRCRAGRPARPGRTAVATRAAAAAAVRRMRPGHADAGLRRRRAAPVPALQAAARCLQPRLCCGLGGPWQGRTRGRGP